MRIISVKNLNQFQPLVFHNERTNFDNEAEPRFAGRRFGCPFPLPYQSTRRWANVPVAKELGECAVGDASLDEEAHGVHGAAAAGPLLRSLLLLPRPRRALARPGGG